jgi:hypothetical protein
VGWKHHELMTGGLLDTYTHNASLQQKTSEEDRNIAKLRKTGMLDRII